ncbi:MAG: hypothetical protein CVT82_10690 [Alphaproteobacteria bacterium HGW-Alphaproteobacteria-4]|nr:MAG: hypothetical protein CVT82_10690 [Alphaproteobacteria bacterium HGW-Alphaproteobacteria-4]
MKTWTIHEVADACAMTTGELSQWIARGQFRPSVTVQPGQRRRFDWRDLACLAVMNALRKHSLSINGMALIVSDLRDDLAGMNDISDISGRSFFCADWGKKQPCPTVGLVTETDLFAVLKRRPETVIIVDVAAVYRDAADAIPAMTAAGGAAQ